MAEKLVPYPSWLREHLPVHCRKSIVYLEIYFLNTSINDHLIVIFHLFLSI